jgi:hypothetical protein
MHRVETKRSLSIEDITAFEQWWVHKRVLISHLEEQCKGRAEAVGMKSTGLGWTAG